jgi:hypothetical protein
VKQTGKLILSPRAIGGHHGTGVQLRHFIDIASHQPVAINYLFPERAADDLSKVIEAKVIEYWPFKLWGRKFLSRNENRIPFRYWSDDRLTPRGKRALLSAIASCNPVLPAIAVAHDERCAKRLNSIHRETGIPFDLILYDWMHLDEPSLESFPQLAECINTARTVYTISPPLHRLALALKGNECPVTIRRIGFYRAMPSFVARKDSPIADATLKVFVIADAKRQPFLELLTSLKELNRQGPRIKLLIHFVGNPRDLAKLAEAHVCDTLSVIFHGVVTSSERDRIAAECDIAYLAGPAVDPMVCPLSKYSLPSKIGDFAAVGLPVVARIASGSAIEEAIREELSEFVLRITSASELFIKLQEIVHDPGCLLAMSESALRYAENHVILPGAIRGLPLLAASA